MKGKRDPCPKLAVAQVAPVAGWVVDTGWVQPAALGGLLQRKGHCQGFVDCLLTRLPLPLSGSECFCIPSREPAGRGAHGRHRAEAEAGGEGPARTLRECTKERLGSSGLCTGCTEMGSLCWMGSCGTEPRAWSSLSRS